jgi:hypothetical protein
MPIEDYSISRVEEFISSLTNSLEKPRDADGVTVTIPIISLHRNGGLDTIGIFHYTAYLFEDTTTKEFPIGIKYLRECHVKSETPLVDCCPPGYYSLEKCIDGYYLAVKNIFYIRIENNIVWYHITHRGNDTWGKDLSVYWKTISSSYQSKINGKLSDSQYRIICEI